MRYKLPEIERSPAGGLPRMAPAQHRRANALIRWECCNYADGDCIALDDGNACACPQKISCSVCCKWFRWAVLPLDGTLEAEIFRDKDTKRCAICGQAFLPKSNRGNIARIAPPEFTGGRKQKVNEKGGRAWTVRQRKSLYL